MTTDRSAQFHALYKDLRIADQRRFYERRAAEYRLAHRQAVRVRNALLGLGALSGVLVQVTSGTGRSVAGIVAAVLAALAGAVTAFEALIGFGPLARLYDDTAVNLAVAEIDWDGAPPEDVAGQLDRVEEVFRIEGGQWGQLAVQSRTEPAAVPQEGQK
jgi:conflict system pore-forming effector with SLATT domain